MSQLRVLALVLVLAVAGCATYYKVDDPSNGKTFYTTKVKREGSAVVFKDAQTGAETTIQNSQVLEIDKKQFKSAVDTK